ncbi:unnamed protein product, partial [Leptidea sinapis]
MVKKSKSNSEEVKSHSEEETDSTRVEPNLSSMKMQNVDVKNAHKIDILHLDQKPYSCNVCDKSFYKSDYLKVKCQMGSNVI